MRAQDRSSSSLVFLLFFIFCLGEPSSIIGKSNSVPGKKDFPKKEEEERRTIIEKGLKDRREWATSNRFDFSLLGYFPTSGIEVRRRRDTYDRINANTPYSKKSKLVLLCPCSKKPNSSAGTESGGSVEFAHLAHLVVPENTRWSFDRLFPHGRVPLSSSMYFRWYGIRKKRWIRTYLAWCSKSKDLEFFLWWDGRGISVPK